MKIKVDNILKVMDIHYSQISERTKNYLEDFYTTYSSDRSSRLEPIISISDAHDRFLSGSAALPSIQKEIGKLYELMISNECGYIRIIIH